jgi:hypothetical protein
MPSTDTSGAGRAAKLRRISAAQGPAPRSTIGAQILGAQYGRALCCPCKPTVIWSESPLQLTLTGSYVYSAQYATVYSNVAFAPLFGQITGVTPPDANVAVTVSHTGSVWTVSFTSDKALTGSFTCLAAFNFACNPAVILEKTFTYLP